MIQWDYHLRSMLRGISPPVKNIRICRGKIGQFAAVRDHDEPNSVRRHTGVDLAIDDMDNTPIYAVADGVVIKATALKDVAIHHGGGLVSRYQHVRNCPVLVGTWVTQGTVVATGSSVDWRPHLHFELRILGVLPGDWNPGDAVVIDPSPYLGLPRGQRPPGPSWPWPGNPRWKDPLFTFQGTLDSLGVVEEGCTEQEVVQGSCALVGSNTYVEVAMDINNTPMVVGRISLEDYDEQKAEQVRLLTAALAAGHDVRVCVSFVQREEDRGAWPHGGLWPHVQAVEFAPRFPPNTKRPKEEL